MQSYAIFRPLQTFSHLFLQLIATTHPKGDKSSKHPQNLSCHNDSFIFFLKKLLSFQDISYLCNQIVNQLQNEETKTSFISCFYDAFDEYISTGDLNSDA